ncbi:MAG: hypothetical protein ACYSWQ_17475 [Planctomycetota bacterium]
MQAVAGEQATLHEAVETRGEESARRLETLSEDHRAVQSHVEQLGETVKHVSAEAVELVTQQVAVGESLQEAHAEALDAQLAGLAAAQEQLHGHVDGLRELMQAVAGDVTNVAREQATLHETVENRGEESVRRLETLSEDHRNVHNHLDQLGEDVKQASAEAAETVTRRVASRESFQAHAEAIEAQMSGIAAAQERLEGNVNTAKVNIEKISAEQASINGTLQDNTSTVAATMGLIEQFQQTLQGEIGSLAQASRRTIASIEEMTVEQASLREIAGRKNPHWPRLAMTSSRRRRTWRQSPAIRTISRTQSAPLVRNLSQSWMLSQTTRNIGAASLTPMRRGPMRCWRTSATCSNRSEPFWRCSTSAPRA